MSLVKSKNVVIQYGDPIFRISLPINKSASGSVRAGSPVKFGGSQFDLPATNEIPMIIDKIRWKDFGVLYGHESGEEFEDALFEAFYPVGVVFLAPCDAAKSAGDLLKPNTSDFNFVDADTANDPKGTPLFKVLLDSEAINSVNYALVTYVGSL